MKYLFYSTALLACLTVISCKENTPLQNDSKIARFSCSIAETKAYDRTWEAGDQIGISGISGAREYLNVRYSTQTGDGDDFKAADDAIYYTNSDAVTFSAYYPWSENLIDGTILEFETNSQSKMKTFDFLWASAVGSSSDSAPVPFSFKHRMSKLTFTLKGENGTGFEDIAKASCQLSGIVNKGVFDTFTGEVLSTGSPENLTFANNKENEEENTGAISENIGNDAVSYTLILIPQTFTKNGPLTVIVRTAQTGTTPEMEFQADLDLSLINGNDGINGFQAGYKYSITMKISNTQASLGQFMIEPWNEVESSSDATM